MLSYRMRRRALPVLCALAFVLPALAACGGTDVRPGADRNTAAVVHGAAPAGSPVQQGTWRDGDENIEWTATTREGILAGVTERYTFGTDGRGDRTLSFDGNAALMRVDETSTQLMQYPDRSPAPSTVQITLQLHGDSVTSSSKLVDGAAGTVRDYEIARLRRHARSIAEHIVTH